MKIPVSFNEFTVQQFVDFKEVQDRKDLEVSDKNIMLVSIASGLTIEQVESRPIYELLDAIKDLQLIEEANGKYKSVICVKGRFYKAIHSGKELSENLERLSTNQYAAYSELIKLDPVKNMASLLPLLYAPYRPFSKPKISKDQSGLAERFKHAKIGDVVGLVFFYTKLYPELMNAMQPYFDQATQEIADHLKEIEEFGKDLDKATAGT